MFRQDFDRTVKPELKKLHDSMKFRIGPTTLLDEEERQYQEIMEYNEPPQDSTPLCNLIATYANYLRGMAMLVNSKK
jgi:hypothetical protein